MNFSWEVLASRAEELPSLIDQGRELRKSVHSASAGRAEESTISSPLAELLAVVLETSGRDVNVEEKHEFEVCTELSSSSNWKKGHDIRQLVQAPNIWASYLPRLL